MISNFEIYWNLFMSYSFIYHEVRSIYWEEVGSRLVENRSKGRQVALWETKKFLNSKGSNHQNRKNLWDRIKTRASLHVTWYKSRDLAKKPNENGHEETEITNWYMKKNLSITNNQGNINQNHMKFHPTPKSMTINKQAKGSSESME